MNHFSLSCNIVSNKTFNHLE